MFSASLTTLDSIELSLVNVFSRSRNGSIICSAFVFMSVVFV